MEIRGPPKIQPLWLIEQERIDLVIGDPLDSLGIEGVGSPADTRAFVTSIAPVFDNAELRRETFSMLGSLLASDGKFSSLESNFLAMVKEIFHV